MSVKGGRKIYRASTNYRKRKARKAAKIFFVILLLAAIVFLGYCVARPVIEYLSDKNGESASASDNKFRKMMQMMIKSGRKIRKKIKRKMM